MKKKKWQQLFLRWGFSRNKNSQGKKWFQGKDETQDREVTCSINK